MKIFWIGIALLAIATAVVLWRDADGDSVDGDLGSTEPRLAGEVAYDDADTISPQRAAAGDVGAPSSTDAGSTDAGQQPAAPPDNPPAGVADATLDDLLDIAPLVETEPSPAPASEDTPAEADAAPTKQSQSRPALIVNGPAAIEEDAASDSDAPAAEASSDATVSGSEDSEVEPAEATVNETEAVPAESFPDLNDIASPETSGGAADAAAGASPNESAAPDAPAIDPAKPEIIPAKIVVQDDGSMLVDDRFVVRGKGTAAEPYQITWDLLISASETYDPRRGRLRLPERVAMLNGEHVQITGNIAFPIVAETSSEMLIMLNQWDGCCIGVPPTPYDAVEVRLGSPATPQQMGTVWGSVTGQFKVEPYLVGDWLLGLYLMSDAKFGGEM